MTGYEVAPFGVATSMVVPGTFTSGTEHFANATPPADEGTVAAYAPIADLQDQIEERLLALTPPDPDVQKVADEITRVVGLPAGPRPMRTVIDPIDDGARAVIEITVERRVAFMERLGLSELLYPQRNLCLVELLAATGRAGPLRGRGPAARAA